MFAVYYHILYIFFRMKISVAVLTGIRHVMITFLSRSLVLLETVGLFSAIQQVWYRLYKMGFTTYNYKIAMYIDQMPKILFTDYKLI